MLGRYGKHLTGSDVREDGEPLESLDFDEETRELIGLDDIAEMIGELEEVDVDVEAMEQEAKAITEGEDIDSERPPGSDTEMTSDVGPTDASDDE